MDLGHAGDLLPFSVLSLVRAELGYCLYVVFCIASILFGPLFRKADALVQDAPFFARPCFTGMPTTYTVAEYPGARSGLFSPFATRLSSYGL